MARDIKPIVVLAVWVLCGIFGYPLQAQSAGELGKQIQDTFAAGNFEESGSKAEAFISKFANLPDVLAAVYVSGVSSYATGKYDLAIKRLKEAYVGKLATATTPPAQHPNPALKQYCLYYLALSFTGKAESQSNDQVAQKSSYQQALDNFDQLLKEYPNTDAKDDISLTRAKIYVQIGAYEKAETQLESLRKSGTTTSGTDIDSMLAWVYLQIARKKAAEFKTDDLAAYNQKARAIFLKLAESENLAVSNDAKYQLAMLDFADKNTDKALKSFRAMRSKDAIIQDQNNRITEAQDKLNLAIRNKASDETVSNLKRIVEKEQQKLEFVRKNPDMAIEAMIMIANTYLQDNKYDEARTYFNYVFPFASDDQKKRIRTQKIISKAMQGLAKEADADFESFRKEFPKDPGAESIDYLIGMQLLAQSKLPDGNVDNPKVQAALDKFDANLKNFPEAAINVEIPKAKATAYLLLRQPDKATESYKKFLDDAKSGKIRIPQAALEDATQLYAISLFSAKNSDEAIKVMKELAASATTESIRRDALYKTAEFLEATQKEQDAIATFKSYIEKYPDTDAAPLGMLKIAQIQEKNQQLDIAIKTYQDFIVKYPANARTPMAYDRIWRIHLMKKDMPAMVKAQNDMIAAYPEDPRCISVYYEQGRLLGAKNDPESQQKSLDAFRKCNEVYLKLSKNGPLHEAYVQTSGYALIKVAEASRNKAKSVNPKAYKDNPEKKAQWVAFTKESLGIYQQAVLRMPGTDISAQVLNIMTDTYVDLINEGVMKMEQASKEISDMTTKTPDASGRIQILIAQSSIPDKLGLHDQARKFIIEVMKNAPPEITLFWSDADRYGNALLEDKQYDKARAYYEQLVKKYQTDKNEFAKASFLYGLGMSYFMAGNAEEAQKHFDLLRKTYPRSPKIPETYLRQGDASKTAGKNEEALDNWKLVVENSLSSINLRAEASFKYAALLEELGDPYTGKHILNSNGAPIIDPKTNSELKASDLAINYYIRVALYFGDANPNLAADSLLRASKLQKKKNRIEEARANLGRIIRDYPNSPVASEARELLTSTPAPVKP